MNKGNNTRAVFKQPKGTRGLQFQNKTLTHVGNPQTKQAKVEPNFTSAIFVAAILHDLYVQQLEVLVTANLTNTRVL